MQWVERKYLNFVSSYLRNFKWKTEQLANCSCPVCGDSDTNKLKARFYFILDNGSYRVYCHNCHYSGSFKYFLKDQHPSLFAEMQTESVTEKLSGLQRVPELKIKPERPVFGTDHVKRLTKLTKLSANHMAMKYVRARKIPENKHKLIYFTENYGGWVNTYMPGKLKDCGHEPRLVFPLYDHRGSFFGCTGRALDVVDKGKKYITIITDDRQSKVYGQGTVDTSKTFFACEGIIDSFFLNNSIAMLGTALTKSNLDLTNAVFVLDNDSRNKEVVRQVERVAIDGRKLFVWPEHITHKDINECVLAGINNMEEIILENTFQGLSAELEVKRWKKC